MKLIRMILAVVALGGAALAQTSSATVSLTVTPAPVPAAVSVTSSATTIPVGGAVNFAVAVSGSTGGATPTGSVELLATVPGSTAKVLINTFTLTNGSMTCSYPVPATATAGVYSLEFAYGGDSNFTKSPDFK